MAMLAIFADGSSKWIGDAEIAAAVASGQKLPSSVMDGHGIEAECFLDRAELS
jgi:hypothetical protein